MFLLWCALSIKIYLKLNFLTSRRGDLVAWGAHIKVLRGMIRFAIMSACSSFVPISTTTLTSGA